MIICSRIIGFLTVTALLVGCGVSTTERLDLPPLQTVARVDIERYMGTWYEIASLPQYFQKGCTGTTATYTLLEDGEVEVLNRCFADSLTGEKKEALGRARVVNGTSNAELEVSFFGPFWGDYWIIELAADYSYAVVGHPSRDYLWILSRSPQMDPATYEAILSRLRNKHRYVLDALSVTEQPPE